MHGWSALGIIKHFTHVNCGSWICIESNSSWKHDSLSLVLCETDIPHWSFLLMGFNLYTVVSMCSRDELVEKNGTLKLSRAPTLQCRNCSKLEHLSLYPGKQLCVSVRYSAFDGLVGSTSSLQLVFHLFPMPLSRHNCIQGLWSWFCWIFKSFRMRNALAFRHVLEFLPLSVYSTCVLWGVALSTGLCNCLNEAIFSGRNC